MSVLCPIDKHMFYGFGEILIHILIESVNINQEFYLLKILVYVKQVLIYVHMNIYH